MAIEYLRLRAKVDARLKRMLREDDLGLLEGGPEVVEVRGSREERVGRLTEVVVSKANEARA